MRSINRYHKPTPTAEYTAYKEDATPETWGKLSDTLSGTVNTAIRSFGGNDSSLRTRARLITKNAVDSWDPSKQGGADLKSHVYNHLKRLNRVRQSRSVGIHVSENIRNDKAAVAKASQEYRDRYDMEPSMVELQKKLQISPSRIRKANLLQYDIPESAGLSEKGDVLSGSSYDDEKHRIWRDYVYHDQDRIGKLLMELVMGHNGRRPVPKKEAARRLKISPAAVSQRINKINARMQEIAI